MIFNKKLLALVIAHFAFAQFVFAAHKDDSEHKSATASRVAKITGDAVQYLDDNFFKVDSAVYTGSKACQGCGHGLLRVTRGTTTVALGLLDRADVLLSGRITNAKVAIAGYEKQAVEYGQSKNYRRIVGAYQWLKENAQYVMFAPAQKLD